MRRKYLARAPALLGQILVGKRYDFTFDLMPMSCRRMPFGKRSNLLRAGLNLLYRRLRPWAWPLHLQIELTNSCTLRCPVCPAGVGAVNRPAAMMDMALYRRLLAEVGPYALTVCLWGWGEPLLYPRLAEACRVARHYGVLPNVSTNGQDLDDPRIVEGLLADPPEYLIVALDGMTDQTNSQFRVGARLAPALAGVRRLAELKRRRGLSRPILHMRLIVMKHNEHEVAALPAFAAGHGFDMLSLRSLSTRPTADETEYTSRLPRDARYRAFEYRDGQRVRRTDYLCQHAFNYPMVLADGTVVPCDQFFDGRESFGRLDGTTSFRQVWFGRQAAEVRGRIRADRRGVPICDGCTFVDRRANTCSVEAHFFGPLTGPGAGRAGCRRSS